MAKKFKPDVVLISKVILFIFILLSPFIKFNTLTFLNNVIIKILLVITLLVLCFVDFQLALIATIAFLILVINMNNNMLIDIKKKMDNFTNSKESDNEQLKSYFSTPSVNIPKDIDMSKNFVCQSSVKNNMNNDMLTYYIDDKIKPYDVFISMLTNEQNINKAQGEVF